MEIDKIKYTDPTLYTDFMSRYGVLNDSNYISVEFYIFMKALNMKIIYPYPRSQGCLKMYTRRLGKRSWILKIHQQGKIYGFME